MVYVWFRQFLLSSRGKGIHTRIMSPDLRIIDMRVCRTSRQPPHHTLLKIRH
jgi:hypothetical protein